MTIRKGSKPVSITHPHLMDEWDFEKNGNVRPENLTYGSGKKVWWKCLVCGFSWYSALYVRSHKKIGCLRCSEEKRVELYFKTKIKNNGSLVETHPELCKEWHPTKNYIGPSSVTFGSRKKAWWVCKKEGCGYVWEAFIFNRTRKTKPRGCPACGGRVLIEGNSLADKFPSLLKEWDFEKNKIKPFKIASKSNKKAWWKCSNTECGYVWKAYIYSRTGGRESGCPVCSKTPVSSVSQEWLDGLGIKIREHHIKELGFRVDGFDPKTNTVYEFLGDYWHGNPKVYNSRGINPSNKKSYGSLYKETMKRIDLLKENGYRVVFIWESAFISVNK